MHDKYFEVTIPVFSKSLSALRGVLEKGKMFAREKQVTDDVFLRSRLAVDMFDLKKQVQVACDNAKGSSARLAGIPVPSHEDSENTFDELIARIDKTLQFIGTITEESYAGAGERKISLPYFGDKHFIGHDYVYAYALPNFFFHVTVAYSILRHLGVPLGKADFMGGLPLRDGKA